MKRRLFIGSSSEGKPIAIKVEEKVKKECGDWINCMPWYGNDCFILNKSTLENLSSLTLICDYAILIASKDDITSKRSCIKRSIRDNVIFEYGLFSGSIGISKTFLLIDKNVHIPSDVKGTTLAYYDDRTIDDKIDNIINQINKSKEEFEYRLLPSSALAVGYYENFITRTIKEVLPKGAKLKILIPNKIFDIVDMANDYCIDNGECSYNISQNTPKVYHYKNNNSLYFDIPMTLSTLYRLISNITKTGPIGINTEQENLIEHELDNFKETLCALIKSHNLTDKVLVSDFTL